MSERDSPFNSVLEQMVFEPKRKLVHEARNPGIPIRERLVSTGFRLTGLFLNGKLPGGLNLAEDRRKTVKTVTETHVAVSLTTSSVAMSLIPGISIDVSLMGEASLNSLTMIFGESEPRIDLRDVGFGIDPRSQIRKVLTAEYGDAIRASVFVRSGYDWTRDPRLFDNLNAFYQSVSTPSGTRSPFTTNLLLESLSVHAVALRDIDAGEDTTHVSLAANQSVQLTVHFQSLLGALLDSINANPRTIEQSIVLHDIEISGSFRLVYEGHELGSIERLRIFPDGRTSVVDFTISNPELTAVERKTNQGFVTLAAFLTLLSEVPKFQALQSASNAELSFNSDRINNAVSTSVKKVAKSVNFEPNFVADLVKRKLEPKLSEKIRQVMRENLHLIPGIDLSKIFNVPGQIK